MYKEILILLSMFYHRVNSVMECTTRGRFPNNYNSDCRGYTMCLSGDTTLTKYDLLCPEHSIYSHLESQCTNVTSYQCYPHHICTLEGDYVDPSSVDCTSYIACVKDLNNIISARLIRCPTNEIFSTVENICVNQSLYKCEFTTESPKILEVSINHYLNTTGNFSSNNAVCISKYFYISLVIFSLFYFDIIINM